MPPAWKEAGWEGDRKIPPNPSETELSSNTDHPGWNKIKTDRRIPKKIR